MQLSGFKQKRRVVRKNSLLEEDMRCNACDIHKAESDTVIVRIPSSSIWQKKPNIVSAYHLNGILGGFCWTNGTAFSPRKWNGLSRII